MKFIKQSSIDNLIDEARIDIVIGATEELKKKGVHYFCFSPFTGEKGTPSLCVHVVKNFFYDNSAGFGGNTVQFIMKKYPTMNFFEAVEKVAEITGIILEYEEQS